MPRSLPVTKNKRNYRGQRVLSSSQPESWLWLSDFETLYAFEQ